MTAECINLKERFGRRYRVEWEPDSHTRDPWYTQIPCAGGRGHICPWGGDMLAACTNTRNMTNRLAMLPYTTVHQDGDDGGNVLFHVDHFDEVAEIMRARKRRQVSEEQRAAYAERLRQYQPAKGQSVQSVARQRRKNGQECVSGVTRRD